MKTNFSTVLCAVLLFTTVFTAKAQNPNKTADWKAQWITIGFTEDATRPAQYFQKEFVCGQKVKSATLYITAHGFYEASIGGKRVGDAYLTPGWTDYNKRLEYQAYDVTALLQKGTNTLNVATGDGWYRGAFGFQFKDYYGKEIALLAQLEITYTNGKKEVIGTDASWKCGNGPIRANSINHGEVYDANIAVTCDKPVAVANIGYDKLIPDGSVLVTKHETFKPKLITTPKGETVLDFGQNLVGWVMVNATGKKGDSIQLVHGEVLDKEGNFYMDNMRTAKVTATYFLNGKKQVYEPHFTYFGFRYAKVSGLKTVNPDDFTAVALYANMAPAGTFECSNPMLNQLQHNIVWGQRGNFLCVPTDCPQRDERLGWTGDAQVFSRTAAFNYDVNQYFAHWMADVALDQHADGVVPHVIPDVLDPNSGGAAGWADVSTIIPWTMYEVYGNTTILKDQYASMKAWVENMRKNSRNDLWNTAWHFGDWLSYRDPHDDGTDAITNKHEIAQCFYAHSTQLLINAAKVLNKPEDVAFYTDLLAKIKAAYKHEYMTGSGRLLSDTQTAYVLALQFDMLPEADRASAAKYLADNIHNYRDHLTTGFLGTPYLCHVLSRFGYTDLAYTLLLQDTFPSWLYPVKMGATTIWERWDGIKTDGTFQTTFMNSFNHYAYGAIGDWMYQNIAGIQLGSPGYKEIIIKPEPGGGLTWCKASYNCPNGKISVNWKLEGGKFLLDVTVPKGSTASVVLPNGTTKKVSAGNHHFEG